MVVTVVMDVVHPHAIAAAIALVIRRATRAMDAAAAAATAAAKAVATVVVVATVADAATRAAAVAIAAVATAVATARSSICESGLFRANGPQPHGTRASRNVPDLLRGPAFFMDRVKCSGCVT